MSYCPGMYCDYGPDHGSRVSVCLQTLGTGHIMLIAAIAGGQPYRDTTRAFMRCRCCRGAEFRPRYYGTVTTEVTRSGERGR